MWEQENGLFIFCYLQTEQSYKRNPKALDQFQYCETNSIPIAIIIGGSEIEMGVVTLRIVGSREEVCDPKYLVVLYSCVNAWNLSYKLLSVHL